MREAAVVGRADADEGRGGDQYTPEEIERVRVAGGIAAQVLAARLRIPAIVLLLGLGFLVGPVLGLLHPSQAFGSNLRPLIGLSSALVANSIPGAAREALAAEVRALSIPDIWLYTLGTFPSEDSVLDAMSRLGA